MNLKVTKKEIKISFYEGYYTGQVNANGDPHGEGVFKSQFNDFWYGTFKDGMMNGYSTL